MKANHNGTKDVYSDLSKVYTGYADGEIDTSGRGTMKANRKSTKDVYSDLSKVYTGYADGEIDRDLFDFATRLYAFEDARLFEYLVARIDAFIRAKELDRIRVLDIGCGPGTWLLRLHSHYRSQQCKVSGVGMDYAPGMIEDALAHKKTYCKKNKMKDIEIDFVIGDICEPLNQYDDSEFDITLCLNTVLNHLPVAKMTDAIREIMRVTRGFNLTTVKPVGGLRTAYVCPVDDVRELRQVEDTLSFLDRDGHECVINSHLFVYYEICSLFQSVARIRDCWGLGVCYSRFMANRASDQGLPREDLVQAEIEAIEEKLSRKPHMIDLANHILILATQK